MDRYFSGASLALAIATSVLFQQSSHAAASCTTTGTSYFGTEYLAVSPPNGSGDYLYDIALLQCSGGKVIKWNGTSGWFKPEDLLASSKTANPNMRRFFTNKCITHLIILHDNYKGIVGGVAANDYRGFNQTHYNVFEEPIFFDAPIELMCPEVPDLGNPDTPAACSAQSNTSPGAPGFLQGDPVNISNGNSYQVELDYLGLPGSQLQFARYYNSQIASWSHTYSAHLKLSPSKALLVKADGSESMFTRSGQTVTASPLELGYLEETATGWLYHSPHNERLLFNPAGQLKRIDHSNGTYETLTYSPDQTLITDNLGRSITLTLNTAKRITSLTANALQVTYAYNTSGRVTGMTRTQNGQSLTRIYHYENTREGGWLTGITDERGVRYVTWAYDTRGRVISNELNGGVEKYLFTYNSNGKTTVTNPLGKKATYTFQSVSGAKRITTLEGEASANCPNSNSTFTYDNRGQIKTRTDNKGHITTYDYNDRGLEISRTEASGTPQARTVTTEWHPTLYLPITVTEPDRIVSIEYDSQGNQLSKTITGL